ncbi:TPA: hypothetical protein ACF4OU_004333, partial [Escherichia coli]
MSSEVDVNIAEFIAFEKLFSSPLIKTSHLILLATPSESALTRCHSSYPPNQSMENDMPAALRVIGK